MPIYMSASPAIMPETGYSFLAETRVGGNGDPFGAPEYDVGSNTNDLISGQTEWTADLSNGFDSGNVPVELDARARGAAQGTTWSVQDAVDGALNYGGSTFDHVDKVEIVAAVQGANMEMQWSSLSVFFYKGGNLIESIRVPDNVDASTIGSGSSTQEETCTVTPTNADNDEVVVSGVVRMRSTGANVQPDANAIFSQVLVFGSSGPRQVPHGRKNGVVNPPAPQAAAPAVTPPKGPWG